MVKKSNKSRGMSLYANLAQKRKRNKDRSARKKAEYLATLPKHPVRRFLHRMHPKRLAKYWFSPEGGKMALKVVGVGVLAAVLFTGSLFAYYRKDLDAIRPGEINKRVQTTVTKYYDRNGELLWEDHGEGDYKLVVESKDINEHMKQATIAIEDQDFYKHHGVSPTGILRAAINNAKGGSVQGGSTLTQQLVKQVFFADEAQERGWGGIPRKIKEVILSLEVERMYDKDQILSLYLNESPYGGRRNGVASGSQTYFNKPPSQLTLAEAALLAGIPNQPGLYDPYNIAGHDALIARQHKVLDSMVNEKFITQSEADEARAVPILDTIQPESTQYKDIKAPHFVQMVRSQLESELGKATVGRGGLTVTTTVDARIQTKLEESMAEMFSSSVPGWAGFTNGAATVEDVQTGQIVAMVGSRDFNYPGFGQDNAATAYIQPGSTIKPLVFAELFRDKPEEAPDYGSGSILRDEPIDDIYGAKLQNADRKFMGNVNIRQGLALSRNVPAVKAMHISGVEPTLKTIRELGNSSYCTRGVEKQTGLSSSIGGCGTRQVDHVNAFASLARMGTYKPHSSVIEVKNSQGEVIKKWKDESKNVIDPQIAYILNDILSDDGARAGLYGRNLLGLNVPGVRTAAKTGTSDLDGKAKDIWMMSYSPALSMGVWLGNSDTRTLNNGNSSLPGPIIAKVMEFAHKEVYAPEGKWSPNSWFDRPEGIQDIRGEIYPSWYNRNNSQSFIKMTFDKVSKKKATDCTPPAARIEVNGIKTVDPVTKREIFIAGGGYDGTKDDDLHKCEDSKPSVSSIDLSSTGGGNYDITIQVRQGTHQLSSLRVSTGGNVIATIPVSGSGSYSTSYRFDRGSHTVTASVEDSALYSGEGSKELRVNGSTRPSDEN